VATAADSRADIFPVNYLVDASTLLFRSAPGTKLDELRSAPEAAFEVEGEDEVGHWSVVIRGTAQIIGDDVAVIGSAALQLQPWAGGAKRNFVRITPSAVSGRRLDRADFDRAHLYL